MALDIEATQAGEEHWPPGTVRLEKLRAREVEIVLHPKPSMDPDDPLNWSKMRKYTNFFLVCFYALMVFVALDIGSVVWGSMMDDIGFSSGQLSNSYACATAGLSVGCIIFIPFALKFGRRPLYLFAIATSFACAIWQAKIKTVGDLYGANLCSGLAGAIAEAICWMTVADVFFVHQRATMNAIYATFVNAGAFLGPVAAGYAADAQGWRWIWWWTSIFLGVCLVAYVFLYEETKYVPILEAVQAEQDSPRNDAEVDDEKRPESTVSHPPIQHGSRKSYFQRLTLTTTTPGGFNEFARHAWQPFRILFTIPGVAYPAIMYGSIAAWYAVLFQIMSIYMTYPPYNFSSSDVGLMSLPPFIGGLIASLYAGPLSDWCILKLAQRNGGIYEPEMRLWLALPIIILGPGAILIFGLSLINSVHWIAPALGLGLFGFCYSVSANLGITYLLDSYKDIVGDSLVAVAFARNALATVVSSSLDAWITGMGNQGVTILTACVCAGIFALTIPMLVFGKRMRAASEETYRKMAARQFHGFQREA